MSLYLDTLKKKKEKTCFQLKKKRRKKRKKERCHFILTSHDCDFVFCFATLFFFRDGDGRDGRRDGGSVYQDCFFFSFFFFLDSHKHTRTVSHSSPAAGPAHFLAWIIL